MVMVKSRLALGSPGWLFGCSSPCRKWPNTQENGSSQSIAWLTRGLVFADVDVDVTGSLKTVVTSLEVCVLFLTFTSVSILLSDYRE